MTQAQYGRRIPPSFHPSTLDFVRRAVSARDGPATSGAKWTDASLAGYLDEALRGVVSRRAELVGLDGEREVWGERGAFTALVAPLLSEGIPMLRDDTAAFLASLHADLSTRLETGPYGSLRAWLVASSDSGIALGTIRQEPLTIDFGERATVLE